MERFWKKVRKTNTCWLWTAGVRGRYGHFRINEQSYLAHRVAWELTYGAIGAGLCVCHKCDVPLCVNPEHLFLGSQSDNIADMHAKNRGNPFGGGKGSSQPKERNGRAKLTNEKVNALREWRWNDVLTHAELSRVCGVSPTTIGYVLNRQRW